MVRTLHTITRAGDEHRDEVVVAGSHGNRYAGYCAMKAGVRAVVLNDAGVGKDRAGIGSLSMLDEQSIPAATVDHESARIGDGDDMYRRGRISHVNDAAAAVGCEPGQSVERCASLMADADPPDASLPEYGQGRHRLRDGGDVRVWGLDSISLLRPDDEGDVVVSGSHGSRLADEADDESFIDVDVAGVTFNDAGIGPDGAGTTRLPYLGERDIPAVTVDCESARIGDSRSSWETGRVSVANESARERGVRPGDTCQEFVEAVLESRA